MNPCMYFCLEIERMDYNFVTDFPTELKYLPGWPVHNYGQENMTGGDRQPEFRQKRE